MSTPFDTSIQVDMKIDNVKKVVDKDINTINNEINKLEEFMNSHNEVIFDSVIISTNPPSGVAKEGTEWIMYKED